MKKNAHHFCNSRGAEIKTAGHCNKNRSNRDKQFATIFRCSCCTNECLCHKRCVGLPRLVPVLMVTEGSVTQYVSAAYWNVPFPWNNNQSWSSGGMNNAWQGCKDNIRGSIHCRSIVLSFTVGKLSNTSSHTPKGMFWNIGEKKSNVHEQFDLIYPSLFYPTFNIIAKIGL